MRRPTLLVLAVLAGALPVPAAASRPAPAPPGVKDLARAYVDFLEAQDLAAAGRTREARARLEAILARDPAAAAVRPVLARLCLRDGDLACATEQAQRAIEADPGDADAHKVLAEIHLATYQGSTPPDRKALERALSHLARAAEADPRDAGTWIVWVRVLGAEGRFAEAEEVTRRAAATPGFDASPVWLALARVMLARGETDRAIALLERVEASGRAAVPLLETLADLKGTRRDFAGQGDVIEKLRALKPDDPLVAQRLGEARLELGDAYGALEPLEAALSDNPTDPVLRRNLARALVRLGRGAEALALLETIPDVYRSPPTLLVWAQAAEQARRYGEAADRLGQLIDGLQPADRSSLGPTFSLREARNRVRADQPARALEILATLPPEPSVLRLRLETLDAVGRPAEADALLDAQRAAAPGSGVVVALDVDRVASGGAAHENAALERGLADLRGAPDRAAGAAAAAGWLVAWGRAPLAAKLLDAAGLPENPAPPVLRARAAVLHAAGRTGEAEAAYRQLLEIAPDDAGALNDLGYLLASQRRSLDEAVAMLRRAVEQQPDEPAFLDSLGWALLQSGRPQEALGFLQRALRRAGDRDEPEIREHLGDVYFALGQADRAVAEWQASLALAEGDRPDLRRKIDETRAASNLR
jgi:tetratricopeptide (TPR) repeat protein